MYVLGNFCPCLTPISQMPPPGQCLTQKIEGLGRVKDLEKNRFRAYPLTILKNLKHKGSKPG